MRARTVLVSSLVATVPGLLWQAFEMYGLTMTGSQMLFFSIVHTMPVAALLVLLAVPAGLLVLGQAAVAYFRSGYRARLGLTKAATGALAGFFAFHFAALLGYEQWSSVEYARVPACIVGLALLGGAVVLTAISLGHPFPPIRSSK